MPIFRLNKIIRIVRIIASTANLESVTSINVTVGRLAKIVLYSFLMLHFVACTWFLYGYTVGLGHSAWGPEHDLHGVTSSYLHSMFFAMTSIGGVGEIRMPSSIFEFLFSAICELVGLFAFACTFNFIIAFFHGSDASFLVVFYFRCHW
jgi:cyclic nucleotide gated channel alpha 4